MSTHETHHLVFISSLIEPTTGEPTNVCFFEPLGRDLVVHVLVVEEVEGLEDVEDEVSQVLVHVDRQDPAVKAVDGVTSVHHLGNAAAQGRATCTVPTRRMAGRFPK